MITDIIGSLRSERHAGDEMAQDLIDRIDAHIRDLEATKAWIRFNFGARSSALGAIVGDDDEAEATPVDEKVATEQAPETVGAVAVGDVYVAGSEIRPIGQ
jgi:hypothetical protein